MEHARVSKVYTVLEAPMLVAGADFHLVMINVGILMFMLMSLRFWYWLLAYWLIHLVLKQLARRDHQARRIYHRYSMQADRYDPWPHRSQKRGLRPAGFGRGAPC